MTKLWFADLNVEYQQEMARLVQQILRERFIGGVPVRPGKSLPLIHPDVLPPPSIDELDISIYEGRVEDYLFLYISNDFGVASLLVTIYDEQGSVIESGQAFDVEDGTGLWGYVISVEVPAGTAVTVQAALTDILGGVGLRQEKTRIPTATRRGPMRNRMS